MESNKCSILLVATVNTGNGLKKMDGNKLTNFKENQQLLYNLPAHFQQLLRVAGQWVNLPADQMDQVA